MSFEVKQGKPLVMLPPAPHLCQICAVDHPEEQPHNAQSFYYQYWFAMNNHRSPTWADAMAHCPEEVKELWLKQFAKFSIDINSPHLTGNIRSVEDLDKRLNQK
jgi:hypothetical protein